MADKYYQDYLKATKGVKHRWSKAGFKKHKIGRFYKKAGLRTVRTKAIEGGLRKSGLTQADINKLRGIK